MGECILPTVTVEGTILNRADGVLPLVALVECGPLDDTSSREAEDTGMKVGKCLCEVFAHTILTSLPCVGGEHADMLYVDIGYRRPEILSLGMGEEKAEMGIVDGLS